MVNEKKEPCSVFKAYYTSINEPAKYGTRKKSLFVSANRRSDIDSHVQNDCGGQSTN